MDSIFNPVTEKRKESPFTILVSPEEIEEGVVVRRRSSGCGCREGNRIEDETAPLPVTVYAPFSIIEYYGVGHWHVHGDGVGCWNGCGCTGLKYVECERVWQREHSQSIRFEQKWRYEPHSILSPVPVFHVLSCEIFRINLGLGSGVQNETISGMTGRPKRSWDSRYRG